MTMNQNILRAKEAKFFLFFMLGILTKKGQTFRGVLVHTVPHWEWQWSEGAK